MSPVKMPALYLKELICDRVAASKIYQGENYTDAHPLEYFMRGTQNRFIHQETSDKIQELLTVLSEQGEDELFRRLRSMKNY